MTNLPIIYANQTKWFPLAPSELMEVSSTACVCKWYPGPGCFSLLLLSLLRSIITFLGCCISLQIHSDNYLCPTQLSVHREGTATPLCNPLSKTFNLIESETHTHTLQLSIKTYLIVSPITIILSHCSFCSSRINLHVVSEHVLKLLTQQRHANYSCLDCCSPGYVHDLFLKILI